MNYSFHPEAEAEFVNSIDYYEGIEKNLGYDFAVEVYSTIERIVSHPQAWPIIETDIRRALVKRFPFGVLYSEEAEGIFIVAMMHLHRNPGYWKNRIQAK